MSERKFRKKASSSRRSYSYSPKSSLRDEEIAAYRKFAVAIALVIFFSTGLYLWGIDAVVALGDFWSNFSSSPRTVNLSSTTPTADSVVLAPNLDPLPLQTNDPEGLEINGWAQSGSEVRVYLNDDPLGTVLVGKDGRFKFNDVTLTEGKNTIHAVAVVKETESKPSETQTVIYDKTKPKLEVSVEDVNMEKGTVGVSGSTEPQATVTVNAHRAIVDLQGEFNYLVTNLKEGENQLQIVATDEAGNEAVVEKTVTYETSNDSTATPSPS